MGKKVFEQSISVIVLASFLVVFLFAVSEVSIIRNFYSRIETTYKNTIDYSSNFWADQFYVANKELKSLVNKNEDTDYNQICRSTDEAKTQELCTNLQNDLTNMSIIDDSQIAFFCFFPDKEIMLFSVSYINYFEDQEKEELKLYLLEEEPGNSAIWKEITLGNKVYFLHTYYCNGSYSGCYISCEKVLSDIMPEDQGCNAFLLNMDGSVFLGLESNAGYKHFFTYSRAIRMINKKIYIEVPYLYFLNGELYIPIVITIAVIASVLMIAIALTTQNLMVFKPLKKLKYAMEEFSRGNMAVRLEEPPTNNEISVLYHTFNYMGEEITHLTTDVYTAQIEKQEIYNQFLRVQIQPHFYTNILNLIYMLAEAGNDETIQILSRNTSKYFRYVLSLNGDYVYLEEELEGIQYYVDVQKIRYQGSFSLNILCNAQKDERIPPLLLLTFVENSIKHNIMLVQDLHIDLCIRAEGEVLHISICDNGLGFSQDILDKLKRGESIETKGHRIGIENIRRRLQALYNGNASMEIENSDKGSTVRICIPRLGKEEAE